MGAYERFNLSASSPTLAVLHKNCEFLFVNSPKHWGPRGDYYSYLVFVEGDIVGVGEEQGNYAGGIYAIEKPNEPIADYVWEELPKELKTFIGEIS